MEGRSRSRHARGHRDRRPSRPPLPPPDYGHKHCSVPLWEREFCCYVGNIPWQRFCENKKYVGPFNNLDHWDDSGALESFQNAKARFWARYHGQPSDVPLPDPDLYIDKVDHHCRVDPELVADLDEVQPSFDSDNTNNNNPAAANEADKKPCQNQPAGNWDVYIEQPAEIGRWAPEERYSKPCDNWVTSSSGWDDAPANPGWPVASSSNRDSSGNRNDFLDGPSNRYQDRSNMPGRKRNGRGHFQHWNGGQRNQAYEGYRRSGWQDRRGGNWEWRPVRSSRDGQSGQGLDGGF